MHPINASTIATSIVESPGLVQFPESRPQVPEKLTAHHADTSQQSRRIRTSKDPLLSTLQTATLLSPQPDVKA